MLIRDLRYPNASVFSHGVFYHFNNYECDVPDQVGLEWLQTGNYVDTNQKATIPEPTAKLFDFSMKKWTDDKKLIFDTAIDMGTGYGKAGVALSIALSHYADVYVVNNGYINSNKLALPQELQDILEKRFDKSDSYYLQFWPAFNFKPLAKRQIGYTMLECSRIPQFWVDTINQSCERVIVPCKMQKQAFLDSGVDKDIAIIPLGVNPDTHPYKERQVTEDFIFGVEGTLTFRKGVDQLVESFQIAFPQDKYPGVKLLIKTREHAGKPFGRKISVKNGKLIVNEDERIEVILGYWDHDKLIQDFYHKINAYAFFTRGEGFGLTTLQAMSTGLPVIATDAGGVQDHVTDRTGYVVKTKLVDVPNDSVWDSRQGVRKAKSMTEYKAVGIGYPYDEGITNLQAEGQQWHDADIEDGSKQLLHVYLNQKEAIEKGKLAAKEVRENWTTDVAAKMIVDYLDSKV